MTQTLKAKLFAAAVVAATLLASVGLAYATAATVFQHGNKNESRYHTFFSATTTSATSTANAFPEERVFDIAGAKKLVMFFSRGGATGPNTGQSRFEIEVSPDGVNWYDFSRMFLTDLSQTATSSVTVAAGTSTTMASVDLEDSGFKYLRCQVVEVTDGDHTCKAFAEF